MSDPATEAPPVSADYSEDELDALAELFDVRALGSSRLLDSDPEDVVLRAVLACATRSLVARRAIMLTGTAQRPQIEFLEPHATLLGTFLGAEEIVIVQRDGRGLSSRLVLFARNELVVTQEALAESAILRLKTYPRGQLPTLARGYLNLDDAVAVTTPAIQTTIAHLIRAENAANGDVDVGTIDEHLRDVIYARRAICEVSVKRQSPARVEQITLRWIDAGVLGLWELGMDANEVAVALRPLDPANVLSSMGLGEPC